MNNLTEKEIEVDYQNWIQSAFFPTIRRLDEKAKNEIVLSYQKAFGEEWERKTKLMLDMDYRRDMQNIPILPPAPSKLPYGLLSRLLKPIAQRYGPCLGLTLFKFGRYKLELWFAPADYDIKEHTHPNSDGTFFVVYGKGRDIWKKTCLSCGSFCGNKNDKESYNISNRNYFRTLKVRANEPHAFSKGKTQMIWLCLEKWKPEVKVTSVATDIKFKNQ